jgi:proton-dependent oligopeptide transporter, POT family
LISIFVAIIGHVILVASAAPGVIENQNSALAAFIIGMFIMGVGTGGFKPNISPLVAEQIPNEQMRVVVNKKGERVIVDPAVTATRVYNYFYMFINIGALIGQIGMAYAERYVGFWLAFFLPTVLFLLCPLVMWACRNKYKRTPPQGSVLGKATKLFFLANKGRWSFNMIKTNRQLHDGTFWENVKPSMIPAERRPKWMTFDDAWVDEVARGFKACEVFLWLPLYWLTYNQLNNNLTSQAGSMTLNGVPNDVISNLDPFALIILIPVVDMFLYPALRKAGINFSPIKKIALGFIFGTLAMIWAVVIQQYM